MVAGEFASARKEDRMDRFFRLMGNGFLTLALSFIAVGLLATPAQVFADDESCTLCIQGCMAMGKSQEECTTGGYCDLSCQQTTVDCKADCDNNCQFVASTNDCNTGCISSLFAPSCNPCSCRIIDPTAAQYDCACKNITE
jgi:hypothetical protein